MLVLEGVVFNGSRVLLDLYIFGREGLTEIDISNPVRTQVGFGLIP